MNDPQIWSMVGLFAAFATVTIGMLRFNNRSLERMIEGLDQSVNARFEGVNARFDGLDAKFTTRLDSFEAKFTARLDGLSVDVGHRLDNVERDLTLIKSHLLEQQRS